MFSDLIALRRNLDGSSAGLQGPVTRIHHQDNESKLLVFSRETLDQDAVLVAVNFSRTECAANVTIPEGHWKVRFNSDANTYSTLFGNHETSDMEGPDAYLSLGPFSCVMFSRA